MELVKTYIKCVCAPQQGSPCTGDSWGCDPCSAPDTWGRRCVRREWPRAHRTIWRTNDRKSTAVIHNTTPARNPIPIFWVFNILLFLIVAKMCNYCIGMQFICVWVCAVTSCTVNTPCLHCPTGQQEQSFLRTLRPMSASLSPHLQRKHYNIRIHIIISILYIIYMISTSSCVKYWIEVNLSRTFDS